MSQVTIKITAASGNVEVTVGGTGIGTSHPDVETALARAVSRVRAAYGIETEATA